jgi:hypothetical protein
MQFSTDVAGHNLPVSFWDQAVQQCLTDLGSVKSKKNADLIYIAAEASNHSGD